MIRGRYVDHDVEDAEAAERELEAWAFRGYDEMMQAGATPDHAERLERRGVPRRPPPYVSVEADTVTDAYTLNEEYDFICERENDRRKE
jgi:hypothetical protein